MEKSLDIGFDGNPSFVRKPLKSDGVNTVEGRKRCALRGRFSASCVGELFYQALNLLNLASEPRIGAYEDRSRHDEMDGGGFGTLKPSAQRGLLFDCMRKASVSASSSHSSFSRNDVCKPSRSTCSRAPSAVHQRQPGWSYSSSSVMTWYLSYDGFDAADFHVSGRMRPRSTRFDDPRSGSFRLRS